MATQIRPRQKMHGRETELRVSFEMMQAAEAGHGGLLLVEGSAGIGKSRLLEESAALAADRGFVLSSGGAPSVTDEAGAQTPASGPAGARPHELIVLDDLQCADSATLWRLRGLSGHPRARRPLWMLARSRGAGDGDAERLFRHLELTGARRIQLGPLSDEAVAALAADALGARPDRELAALAAGAGGNPLLLTGLLAGLRSEGRIRLDDRCAALASTDLPAGLRAIVSRWVGQLGPRGRQFLEVGAVLGRSFPLENVAALLGETPAGLLPVLEAAIAADILVATPQLLTFRRELVWRAIAESVPGAARQALHRQIGEFLLDHGGSAAEAAEHLVSGGPPGAPTVLARLDGIAQASLVTAPQAAADLTLQALGLTSPLDPDRFGRIVAAVRALTAAGQLAKAEAVARSSLAEPAPAASSIELRLMLSSILFYSGRPAAAVACAEALLGEPELRGAVHLEAESTLLLGLSACARDVSRARERAEAILADAGRHDDALRLTALLARAVISWRDGRLSDALGAAREAVRLDDTGRASGCQGTARLLLAGMLAATGQLDEADAAIGPRGGDATAAGCGGHPASTEILAGLVALADGRPAAAADAAAAGLRLAAARGTQLFSLASLSLLATTALRAGDLRTAARHVTRFQERLSEHGPCFGLTRCLLVAAQVAEVRGDAGTADQRAARLYSMVARRPGALLDDLTASAWLVRFALSRSDTRHAEQIADAAARLAADNPDFAYVRAAAAHARGLVDRDPTALSIAAAGCRDPWARASAAEDLGILLTKRQDRPRATRLLEDSLAGYDRVAALRDTRRVRHRLRELGVRRRHYTCADRPASGWASLTDTEHAVCGLVAQGLTNQGIANEMFLSTHTIAFHLRQVFRKLDIRSRVDLAREFTEHSQAAGKAWVY